MPSNLSTDPSLPEFLRACADGRVDAMREHLERDPGLVRARPPDGNTALHLAISCDRSSRPIRNPLARRRSRFENRHTPLHAVFAPPDGLGPLTGTPNYAMLQLLIGLGADLDATDDKGRTPFDVAMLRGDMDAMRILRAAGAKEPELAAGTDTTGRMAALAASIKKSDPMFSVADMRATVQWYRSIGFTVLQQHEDQGELMFAKIGFGACEFGLSPGGAPGPRDVSLWFYTDRVQELYQILKDRQIRAAQAALAGSSAETGVRFLEDLYSPFYGGRQFSIEDPNGLTLIFWHPDWL